jgi:putative membrane-bound dehydrogenase-like protein
MAFMALGGSSRVLYAGPTNPPPVLPPLISYLSPVDEAKTFVVKDGYHLELVLSDPIIKEPVLTVFDGNGRMYVAEMRSYMQDIDGNNQRAKIGRVSLHWSSKGNGIYDKHTVFVDNLVLPRMVLPLADGVVINETDSEDYWLYRDTKGTGVADQKTLFYGGGGRGGNLEHQPSGLIWALDNWLYMAVNAYRLRVQGTNAIREPTASNFGQWGICQDDYGKVWNVNAGYEAGPVNFQVPILYAGFDIKDEPEDWWTVYPLIGLADVQGGAVRYRPQEKSLNHYTGTCGPDIYRGDRLPPDLRGDLLFAEPVGRMIRRAKVEVKEGFTRLFNAYPQSEFVLSTDPDFRPVNLADAPDGSIYISDMYRGIIQEKDWVNQGSYLRGVVQQYNLDKNFGRGRIWRLVHDSFKPGPQPHMLDEPSAKLVTHLESLNGWWRDTAQKLLVLRGDKSVAPALIEMANTSTNHLARIHAIWTLEGLGALEPALLREKFKDPHPEVRVAAIRASETLYKQGDHSLVADISTLGKDADANVAIQVMLTANLLKWPGWDTLIRSVIATNHADGVKRIGAEVSPPPPAPVVTAPNAPPVPQPAQFSAEEKAVFEQGRIIYMQLCFACHAPDGRGTPLAGAKPGTTMAPPLGGSKTATGYLDGVIDVLLKGLHGPVDGKNYDAQMVPMESNDDAWVANVISFVRNNFGNHSTFITTNDVARVRALIKEHTNTWTLTELRDSLPQPLPNRKQWKLIASHNPQSLPAAIDGNINTRYTTGSPQIPGMWVQIELPQESEIAGVELDAGNSFQDYPRGYKIELSTNGVDWGDPVAIGRATAARNQILFASSTTKFIRITQTGADQKHPWSIHELQVLKILSAEDWLQPPELFPEATSAAQSAQNEPPPPEEHTPYTVE